MRTSRALVVVIGLGVTALAACKSAPPKQVGDDDSFTAPEGGKSDIDQSNLHDPSNNLERGTSSDTPTTPDPPGMEGLDEDQKAQFKVALRRGKDKAAQCPGVVKGAPTGKGEVQVTFDGQKGRATEASVGSPFAGTDVESCIQKSFVGEVVLPFDGKPRMVSQEIELKAAPAAATTDPKKGPKKPGAK